MKKLLFIGLLLGCNEYHMDWGNAVCTSYCLKLHPEYGPNVMAGKDESGACICERMYPQCTGKGCKHE